MKRFVLISFAAIFAALSCPRASAQYTDHRGRNVDSLETAVARWTPQDIATASDSELGVLVNAYEGLMQGYLQVNGMKSEFYARKMLDIATSKGWQSSIKDAAKIIGQIFWAKEQYDSAAFYYNIALEALGKMASGATSPTDPDGYDQKKIDDGYSSMYGTLGNLYNMMGDLDKAFEYYAKAGEIFDKYGWNESNAVLYYNIGETWLDEKDYTQALPAYEKSLDYARTAGDSLLVANALKGLGGLYLEKGKTWKA
ncbi:MAG: tetratricopeptide repeat protein, partial [Bacteroidales bacterium]|nr:tetratricopeptide repeat protein [Bacteroidales bacterium]